MTLAKDVDRMLPIVADSWSKLRKCDVYRLIDLYPTRQLSRVGAVIVMNRPDLLSEVDVCVGDILHDRH